MQVTMNYGKNGLALDLPENRAIQVIEKIGMPVLPDPGQAVLDALNSPVRAKSLREEAREKQTACILICDITRPVPNGLILPPIIRQLLDAGMKAENITVLIATGLHRPNEHGEMQELVGSDWVLKTVTVVNHFAENDEDHLYVARTRRGTPVMLDRRFLQADLKIVTGLVEPHFMAGYSGGRKVIAPGIAHRDTITTFHNATFMENLHCANCVLKGNPLHEEQLEIVQMLGRILAVNTVLDDNRNLSFINYGEIVESHAWAVEFMRRYAEITVDRRFDTVITSGGGYPLDKTYYQTVKGLVGAMDIVSPGGNLIIFSECSEGMGSPDFIAAQQRLVKLGPDAFLQSLLEKSRADIDEWETEMQLKPMRRATLHLFSDRLAAAGRALTGIDCNANGQPPADFLGKIIEKAPGGDIGVIPEGPYVIPKSGLATGL